MSSDPRSASARFRSVVPVLPLLLVALAPALVTADKATIAARPGAAEGIERTADGEPARFRVDMVMERDGQRVTMRRYVDGARSRMETEVEGEKMAIIDLGDESGTTYMLMHSRKQAIKSSMRVADETAAKVAGGDEAPGDAAPEGKLEKLGDETLGGKAAEKFRVVTDEGTGLMWIETATQLPLRFEAEGMRVDMTNYDFGPQSPDLFQVPKKYDVLDMDEVMKSLGPGGDKRMAGMAGGVPGMGGMGGGGMTEGMAGDMGGMLGGQLGAGLGASVGGPVGSMIGQYLGQRVGQAVGRKAAKTVGAP